jgi:hypothetical protein
MKGNSFSRTFLSPRAKTPSIIIRLHPYSNFTCISSWYICIPNIIWIHLTVTEKMNGNCNYQECDRRTNGEPDGHCHTIINPVFNRHIKIGWSNLDIIFSRTTRPEKLRQIYMKVFWQSYIELILSNSRSPGVKIGHNRVNHFYVCFNRKSFLAHLS